MASMHGSGSPRNLDMSRRVVRARRTETSRITMKRDRAPCRKFHAAANRVCALALAAALRMRRHAGEVADSGWPVGRSTLAYRYEAAHVHEFLLNVGPPPRGKVSRLPNTGDHTHIAS
jgi:hypothetical protein